ncbi:unnamed protein product [Parajaminaea phylloscopi]
MHETRPDHLYFLQRKEPSTVAYRLQEHGDHECQTMVAPSLGGVSASATRCASQSAVHRASLPLSNRLRTATSARSPCPLLVASARNGSNGLRYSATEAFATNHSAFASQSRPLISFLGQEASDSGPNLELHPTPVDASLFEDPEDRVYAPTEEVLADSQDTYTPPLASEILERTLRQNGPRLSRQQLAQARLILQEFSDVHGGNLEALGKPSTAFAPAAYVSYTFGKPLEAQEWLELIPAQDSPLSEAGYQEMVDYLGLTLNMLKARLQNNTHTVRRCLMALIRKRWHGDAQTAFKMLGCVKDLLHMMPKRNSVLQFWLTLLAASREADLVRTQEDLQSIQAMDRQAFLCASYNAAVRHLALTPTRLPEAVQLVQYTLAAVREGVGKDAVWVAPPVTFHTYKILLEQLVCAENEKLLFAANALNNDVMLLSELMPKAAVRKRRARSLIRKTSDSKSPQSTIRFLKIGRAGDPTPTWNQSQAYRLYRYGFHILSETIDMVSQSQRHRLQPKWRNFGKTSKRSLETRLQSVQDTVIQAHIEAGSVAEARSTLMQRIAMGPELASGNMHLPSARCLAAYQSSICPGQSSNFSIPLAVARDEEVQQALLCSRAGKGLWETAHLWRLEREKRYEEGLEYYMATWHTSGDVSKQLIETALNRPASSSDPESESEMDMRPLDESEATIEATSDHPGRLWPSSHTQTIALRMLLSQLRRATSLEGEHWTRLELRTQIASAFSRLESCWRLWHEHLGQQMVDGTLGDRRLSSRAFDPWLSAFAATLTKLTALDRSSGLNAQHLSPRYSRNVDITAQIRALTIFKGIRGTGTRCEVSPASAQVIHLLKRMQNLGVAPSRATLSIVLDTLARDSVDASCRSVLHDVPGQTQASDRNEARAVTCWSLILHLLRTMGMADVEVPDDLQSSSDASIASDRAAAMGHAPRGDLTSYCAVLRGTLVARGRDERQSATPLAQARQITRWLGEAVRRGQDQKQEQDQGQDQDENGDDGEDSADTRLAFSAEDLESHESIVNLLTAVKEWARPQAETDAAVAAGADVPLRQRLRLQEERVRAVNEARRMYKTKRQETRAENAA